MDTKAALLFERRNRYEIHSVELDPPKDHEVLVRMVASGLCHSDLHILTGDHLVPLPMCPGHEGAGVVERVGRSVDRLQPGDHVVTSFIPSCGYCRYCAAGKSNLCDLGAIMASGPQLDGTYRMHLGDEDIHQFLTISTLSERSVVSELSLVKIPKDVPLESMCLLGCGVGTGFGTAVNAAEVRPGDVVIVMGVGGVGINAVQGAAIAGARAVIAVDPVPFKLEVSLKLGATHGFATVAEAAELARSLTNGQGADSAIVTVDRPTGEHVAEVFDAIGKSGIVVVAGVASQKANPMVPINLSMLVGYQKRIQGALFGMCTPAADILRQIDMYRSGQLKLDELITRTYSLDDVNGAVDDLIEGRNIRGVIVHDH